MKPAREHATNNGQTYFVTSDTWERRALFRNEAWARLFFKALLSYRGKDFLLHEFVLMPDHFHLLISPTSALEHAVQLIKGGFSFRVKRELGFNGEVWHRGFSDHRIRDVEDYDRHVHYIHLNPVKKHLCKEPAEYRYSSAYTGWKLDPIPQWLKPLDIEPLYGTTEVVPFQTSDAPLGTTKGMLLQTSDARLGETKGVSFRDSASHDTFPIVQSTFVSQGRDKQNNATQK